MVAHPVACSGPADARSLSRAPGFGKRSTGRRAPPSVRVVAGQGPQLWWPGRRGTDDAQGPRSGASGPSVPAPTLRTLERVEPDRVAPDAVGAARASPDGAAPSADRLVRGDNARVMQALLPELRGQVDLAYIDPPFDLGIDHKMRVASGAGGRGEEVVAYRDRFGTGGTAYLEMLWERLVLVRELLADTGSLLVHCDWHQSHLIRTLLGELFGARHFVNEIVWWYYNKIQGNVGRFAANHDVILWFRKGDSFTFHPQHEARERPVRQLVRVWDREKRALVNARDALGRVHYRESATRSLGDVWRLPMLQPADRRENTGYATQKPEALLERIVRAASNEGELVVDVFCGSGTTAAVAARLGRRWLAVDAERLAVHVARKRLIGVQSALGDAALPFEICDLAGAAAAEAPPSVAAHARLRESPAGLVADVELAEFGPGLARLDFWAVDFLPRAGAPFVPRWRAYRTRRDPALPLTSDAAWRYSGPGPHPARVQAIDVLGHEVFCDVCFELPAS